MQLVNELEKFCFMSYKLTPSKHWKYEPLSEYEEFDAKIEMQRINDLHKKAKTLKPLYIEVKEILSRFHINLKELNRKASEFYHKEENLTECSTD